jgi:hypothetical protein|tara:strand:+ start:740 stop:1156 length:417 start_codon:yes stop_codon:yes gene_type:complete
MGTRSLTYIKDEYEHNDNIIICMYRQYDGYLSGHGKELAEFLQDFNVVNGYNMHTPARSFNGMGCLAAQLVAHFKDGIGNIYLYPPNTSDVGEEFIYVISLIDNQINIEVRDVWNNKIIFSGTPKEVLTEMEIINYGE